MGIWELEAGIGVLMFLLTLPALSFFVVRYAYRTYGRLAALPTVVALSTVLFGAGVVAFTLFPLPDNSDEACRTGPLPWRINPLDSFTELVDAAEEVGFSAFLTSPELLQVVMNVLLFVPLGALIGWRTRRSLAFTAGVALACSLMVELTQGTGVWGVYDCSYRFADLQDLITNTSGAVVGWLLGRKLLVRVPWPQRSSIPGMRSPSELLPRMGTRLLSVFLDIIAVVLLGVALQVLAAVVAEWIDPAAEPASWPAVAAVVLSTFVPALVVGLAMPMARADRAGPGAWATFLSIRRLDAAGPPSVGQMTVRTAVRWTPFVVLSIGGPLAALAFLAMATIQLLTVLLRRDHASLAGMASRTRSEPVHSMADAGHSGRRGADPGLDTRGPGAGTF